jgi:glycosyltransferase involved in cell wall biosynthesis
MMETDELNFSLPLNFKFPSPIRSYSIVYDIIPHLFPQIYIPTPEHKKQYYAHLNVKLSADILFSISEHTKKDIIEHFAVAPERIVVIGGGIDPEMSEGPTLSEGDFRAQFGLTKDYVLYLGGDEYRKNLIGLTEAFPLADARVVETHQVLIGGNVSADTKRIIEDARLKAGLADNIFVFAGYLSEDELRAAYRYGAICVIPSLYEGFGLPVLEAMAHGAIVIASGQTSMAEILTDQRFLFNPNNRQELATTLSFAILNPDAANALREQYSQIVASFSWRKVAIRVVETMKSFEPSLDRTRLLPAEANPAPMPIVTLGKPQPNWLQLIKAFSMETIVRVYVMAKTEEVDFDIPARNLHPGQLQLEREPDFPTLVLCSDLDLLGKYLDMNGISEHIFCFNTETYENIAKASAQQDQIPDSTVAKWIARLLPKFIVKRDSSDLIKALIQHGHIIVDGQQSRMASADVMADDQPVLGKLNAGDWGIVDAFRASYLKLKIASPLKYAQWLRDILDEDRASWPLRRQTAEAFSRAMRPPTPIRSSLPETGAPVAHQALRQEQYPTPSRDPDE